MSYDPLDAETDVSKVKWKDLALCDGLPTNLYYDDYENDVHTALMIDEGCLSCPIMKQCGKAGVENKEWGVWGGVYLVNGVADKNKNSHKTKETWKAIRERIV